jgi:hypothetical protein
MDNELPSNAEILSWHSPIVQRAVKELIPQLLAANPQPNISNADISPNERALAFYLARAFIRISAMVREEIAYARLIS